MNRTATVPRSVDDITTDWLTAALGARFPGIEVVNIVDQQVIWGTATKVLLNVEYASPPSGDAPGRRLCVKGELDDRVRGTIEQWTTTPTQLEVAFYEQLAPRLRVPLSPVYFTAAQKGLGGVLIMDDLTVQGAEFGDPRHAWSPESVASGLRALASLHGSTWGKDFSDIAFIQVGSPAVRSAVEALFSEANWTQARAADDAVPLSAGLDDRGRILAGYHRLFVADDAAAASIIHGDAHLGNAFRRPSGEVVFIDWAGPCLAPWSFDVAYFLTGALSVEDRRQHERDLLEGYFAALADSGGPVMDRADGWEDYRRHQLHGVIWAMLPAALQSRDAVHAMSERYAAAIEDHATLELLGV